MNLANHIRLKKWKDVFDAQLSVNPIQVIKDTITGHAPQFSLPIGEDTTKWTEWLSEEALLSRLTTLSQIAILKGEEREAWLKLFKEIIQGEDVERNGKGEIAVHGTTFFFWTDRL